MPLALLPAHSTFHETVALLKHSSVTLLFVSKRLYPHGLAAAKEIGLPETKIFILQGEIKGKMSLPRLIDNVKTRGLPRVPTQPVGDDTLAYLVFSSGTTGLPKGYFIHLLHIWSLQNLNPSSRYDFASQLDILRLAAVESGRGDRQSIHGKKSFSLPQDVN